jgi:hypothetical protein
MTTKKPEVICVVECPSGFNDMSVYPEYVPPGGRVEIDEGKLNQMKMSDPTVICIEKRMEVGSKAHKEMLKLKEEKDAQKQAIHDKHAKDAPPRRKKGSGGRNLGALDTARPVSSAELVHLPVTKTSDGE